MSQTPRRINTDRSLNRPDQAASTAHRTVGQHSAASGSGGQHAAPRRPASSGNQNVPRRPAQSGNNGAPRRRRKKKRTPLWLPFAIVMGVIAVISGVVVYGVGLVNKVEDSIRPAESAPSIVEIGRAHV